MIGRVKNERQYICFSGISNNALSGGALPGRLKFLSWGVNPSQQGDILVNDQTAAALAAQIADKAFERIVIDFEHNSEEKHPNFQKAPRHHAGYGTLSVVKGDGIYLDAIEWTPAGKEFAKNYSDLSPVVNLEKDRTVRRVKSLALTPNGALHDVTFFSADDGANQPEENTMDLATLNATIEAQKTTITALNAKLDAQVTESAKSTGTLTALSATITALQADLAEVKASQVSAQRVAIVDRAARDGKVIPLSAEDIAKMDVVTLSAMVDKLPATVPLTRTTPVIAGAPAGDTDKKAAQHAAAVRNRACELQRTQNISFSSAWNQAEAELAL